MQALLALSNGIDAVSKKFGQLASYLVLFCALISAGNATVRYLFSMSSNGWLEIQWYMFGGIVLFGASQTLKMNAHIRVDLFYGMYSPRVRLWVDIVGILLFLLPVMILFCALCWPFFFASLSSCFKAAPLVDPSGAAEGAFAAIGRFLGAITNSPSCEMSSNAGGLIRWPAKLLLVVGFGMVALQGVSELIKRIAALIGLSDVDTSYEKPMQ